MSGKQHILVLGATGVSGIIFVRHVLSLPADSQPKLTLLVRTPSKLPSEVSKSSVIRIVKGELSNTNALDEAMSSGITAVVSFLGAYVTFWPIILRRTEPTPIADSMPAVFDSMRKHGVKRVMTLSTPGGFPQPQENPSQIPWKFWLLGYVMPKVVVPLGNSEMRKIGERTSRQDDLEWTAYRVPHLNEGDASLEVVAGYVSHEFKGSTELSRGSLARWILRELEERKWVKKAPALGNP